MSINPEQYKSLEDCYNGIDNYDERMSRIALEMGRLFLPRHDDVQTPEYEAWRRLYIHTLCDKVFDPEKRNPEVSGF